MLYILNPCSLELLCITKLLLIVSLKAYCPLSNYKLLLFYSIDNQDYIFLTVRCNENFNSFNVNFLPMSMRVSLYHPIYNFF